MKGNVMDIIFLNPPKSKNPTHHVLNMALLWLASILESHNIKTKVFTIMGDKIEEEVVKAIEITKPKYVAVSCKWWNTLYSALEIAKIIRNHNPDIKILTGGHTATVFSKEIIATGLVDIVMLGDSEESILEIVRDGNIPGGTSSIQGHFDKDRVFMDEEFLMNEYGLVAADNLVDRPELVPAYVWTGRGCSHQCFYCAENSETAKLIFGTRIPFVRSPKQVAKDIAILGERSHLIFDYEYPSFDGTDEYIRKMISYLPEKDFRCYFFSWGLPSKRLIDIFSERFSYTSICIDIQVFSETLRKKLSEKKLIKPFYSDKELYDLIAYAESKGNIIIDGTGIAGYPFETDNDREIGIQFIRNLHENFHCVRDVRPSPLHVIPGTPMALTDDYYDLTVVRHNFDDFLSFTKESFENEVTYYSTERSFHPYGVYPKGQPMAIVKYMHRINGLLDELRNRKTKIEKTISESRVSIIMEDIYNPMKSLIDTLNAIPDDKSYRELNISLGYNTWFHHSWIDYTSESGENCASIMGTERNYIKLSQKLETKLKKFDKISLDNADDPSWGVIGKLVSDLNLSVIGHK
jgi:radical SAM superfamily enzyme YgiQ (UPF0313 family)